MDFPVQVFQVSHAVASALQLSYRGPASPGTFVKNALASSVPFPCVYSALMQATQLPSLSHGGEPQEN